MVVLACACAALSGWFGGTRGGMPQSAGVSKPVDMGELETKSVLPLGFTNCFTNFTAGALKIVEQREKRNPVGNLVRGILFSPGKYSSPCRVPPPPLDGRPHHLTDGPPIHP